MQDSLRAAFERHYVPLVRSCMLLTGSKHAAEDIVQEAFVRVAPRLSALGQDEVRPYLRRSVVNLWKNHLRRLAVERRHRRDVHAGTSQEDALEDRHVVRRAVMRLPPRQRACIVLRYFEGLREREVAQVLGCSVGTVKRHTSRALARQRQELGDEY
ncbi:MAG TPA: SigE family RNA polymerase sigma factor [Actinomycetota bacterium]|nr:SigE family RNA polymerase sigma factor [Actinomycetota bacterium]